MDRPATPLPTTSADAPPRWVPVVLVVAVLLVFGRTAAFDFTTWDDRITIYDNPRLNPPTAGALLHYWTTPEYGLWVPVTYTAWAGLASVARLDRPDELGVQLNPYVFHAANVAAHAGAAVVAFLLLRRLLASRAESPGDAAESAEREERSVFAGASRVDLAALGGSLLFALHPVQVESVAWVSGLKDVLAGLFGLAALLGYVAAVGSDARRRAATAYALATAALVLALLSKPSAVTVPLLAAALDRLVLGRGWRAVARSIGPWLALAAAVAVVAKVAQPGVESDPGPLWLRPLVAGDALAFYLGKLAWPVGLGIDYGRTPAVARASGWFWAAWLVPTAIGVGLFLTRRRYPTVAAAGAVFALAPLPVLGGLPFMFQLYSTVADHYLYMAMLGPALLLARTLSRCPRGRAFAAACGVSVAVLVALAARSVDQAGHWRDNRSLFRRVVAVNPTSWPGLINLGSDFDVRRDPSRAVALYRRSIEARPEQVTAYSNLARSLVRLGEYDEAERTFAEALRRRAAAPPGEQFDLGDEYARFGSRMLEAGQAARAKPYLAEAVRRMPGDDDLRHDYRTASELAP